MTKALTAHRSHSGADRLESVVGIGLYGSVARGEADRRSDIDLWVFVAEDRLENQRTANHVRQDLTDSDRRSDSHDRRTDQPQ
jgi:predicted nucleotidyltransferase